MSKTEIQMPFDGWIVTEGELKRSSNQVGVTVYAYSLRVIVEGAGIYETLYGFSNLREAIIAADKYIEDNFEVAKSAEEKLKDALAEIDQLKAKLADGPSLPEPLKVGQKVKVTLQDDPYYQKVLLIDEVVDWSGKPAYRVTYYDGKDGIYFRREIEPVW